MGGGRSKSGQIEKISASSKRQVRQLLRQQQQAETRAAEQQAADISLLRQQLDQQNLTIQQQQQLYNQQLTEQQGLSRQYQSGLNEQLGLLRQRNSILGRQANEQSKYYQAQRGFFQEQQRMNLAQQQRAREETRYTSMLESQESEQSALQANRITQQLNRRRQIQRLAGSTRRI